MKDIRINKKANFNQLQNKSCSVLVEFFLNFYAKIIKKYLDKVNSPIFFENANSLVYLSNQTTDSEKLESIIDLLKQLRLSVTEPNVTIQNNTVIRRQILEQLQNEVARSEGKLGSEKELEVLHSTTFDKKHLTKTINSFINLKKKSELYNELKVTNNKHQVNNWLDSIVRRHRNTFVNISNKKFIEKYAFFTSEQKLNRISSTENKLSYKNYKFKQTNEKISEIQNYIETVPTKTKIFVNKLKTEKFQNIDTKTEIEKEIKLQAKEKISKLVKKSKLEIQKSKVEKKEKSEIKPKQKFKIISKTKKTKTDSAKKTSQILKTDETNKTSAIKPLNLQETFLQIRKFNDKILENKIKKLRVNTVVNIHALTKKDLLGQNIYKKINKKVSSEILKNRFFNSFSKNITRAVLVNRNFNNLVISEDYENLVKNVTNNEINKIKTQSQKFLLSRKNKKNLYDKKTKTKFLDFYQYEELTKKSNLNLLNKNIITKIKSEKNFFNKKIFSNNIFLNKKDRISHNLESFFLENLFEKQGYTSNFNKKISKTSENLKYLDFHTDFSDEIQTKNKKIDQTKKYNKKIVKNILSDKEIFTKKLLLTNIFLNKKNKISHNFESYFPENILEKQEYIENIDKKVFKTSENLKYLNFQTNFLDSIQIKNKKIDQFKIYNEKLRKKVLFNLDKKILFKNKKSHYNSGITLKIQHKNIYESLNHKFNIHKNKIYFEDTVVNQDVHEPKMIYKKNVNIDEILDQKIKNHEKSNKDFKSENVPKTHINQKFKNLTEHQYFENKKVLTQTEIEEIVRSYVNSINFEAISNKAVNKIKNNIILDRQRHGYI